MPVDFYLVKYELDPDGAYIDTSSDLICSITVSDEIYDAIMATEHGDPPQISSLEVFEETDKNKSFEVDCFQPNDVSKIRDRLREIFRDKVSAAAREFENSSTDLPGSESLERYFSQFRAITGLDELLSLKVMSYGTDAGVVVRVA